MASTYSACLGFVLLAMMIQDVPPNIAGAPGSAIWLGGVAIVMVTALANLWVSERARRDARADAEAKKERDDAAAKKVDEVKKAADLATAAAKKQDEKHDVVLNAIKEVGETNHKFLNSKVGFQLKKQAFSERRIADLTGESGDIKKAEEAEEEWEAHQKAQKAVDALNADTMVPELKPKPADHSDER